MRKAVKMLILGLVGALALGLVALVAFYFWASSGRLAEAELAQVRHYEAPPPPLRDELVVVSYNIGYLSGMTNNQAVDAPAELFERNGAAALELFRRLDADLVALQEIDLDSARSESVDQVALLARGAGFGFDAVAVNWDKRYVPFPYWPPAAHFGRMLSAQALLSRYPIASHRRTVLAPPAAAPFYYRAFYLDRLAQHATITLGPRELHVVNVHLEAFDQATREAQADEVLALVRELGDVPLLLLGDFNCVPPEASQQGHFADEPETDFASDRTLARFLAEPALAEALSPLAGPEAATWTFPADAPNRRLDYIFYSRAAFEAVEARVVHEAGTTSDHLPLLLRLRWRE